MSNSITDARVIVLLKGIAAGDYSIYYIGEKFDEVFAGFFRCVAISKIEPFETFYIEMGIDCNSCDGVYFILNKQTGDCWRSAESKTMDVYQYEIGADGDAIETAFEKAEKPSDFALGEMVGSLSALTVKKN